MEFSPQLTPIELAENAAMNDFFTSSRLSERTRRDYEVLRSLDHAADQLDLIGKEYWATTHKAMAMPIEYNEEAEVTIRDFSQEELHFYGTFIGYSKVVAGKIIGAYYVRALCATFNNSTLFPYVEKVPDDHLLHVPVMAVSSIDQSSD